MRKRAGILRTVMMSIMASMASMAFSQTVIDVMAPKNGEDATRLLQEAIDKTRLSNSSDSTIIRLGTSSYNISKENSTSRLFHVSNTTREKQNPECIKHIGLHLRHLRNVIIDGMGSTLITHGEMTTFLIDSCENITLRNLTIKADDPSMPEARIIEVGNNHIIMRCSSDTHYRISSDGKLYWTGHGWEFTGGIAQVYNPEDNTTLRTDSPMDSLLKAEELGPGLLKLYYSSHREMRVGTIYQMRHSFRTEVCGCINRSKDITLERMEFNYLGNFGIVGQFSENLTYKNIRCAPAHESDRTGAGFADFVQMSGCRGMIRILDSYFEGAHDDPINIHGTHLKVTEWRDKRHAVVRFMHPETFGFLPFSKDDEVEVVDVETLLPLQTLVISESRMLSDYECLVSFDRDADLKRISERTTALENVTWTPQVEICGNYFARIPTRGILITTRRPVIIEDNQFLRMPMASILINDDASGWYESGPAHDVTIRRNRFLECSSPVLQIWPENKRHEGPVHKNITICNNTFSFMDKEKPVAVRARSTDNIKVFSNYFDTDKPEPGLYEMSNCSNVRIENNNQNKK